jgi:hypothetical protein
MRLSLGIISSAIIAVSMVHAVPTDLSNSGVDTQDFKENQVAQLEMQEKFEPFHWMTKNDASLVDREFNFELKEPAELQVTDFMKGKKLLHK